MQETSDVASDLRLCHLQLRERLEREREKIENGERTRGNERRKKQS